MHRTQIYLEDRHYEILRTRARRHEQTLAAVIREIINEHLAGALNKGTADPMNEVIGLGEGDGTAVAENYEEHLYGLGDRS